jgi:hypothetical protein
MNYYLIEDVVSYNFKVYAKKGDIVKLVSDRDNVVIIEDSKGYRFTTKKTNLSEDKIQKDDTGGNNGMVSGRPIPKSRRTR